MLAHLRYAKVVAKHKWFVLVAGVRIGAPLGRLILHDWTKLTRAEWGPYVRRFCTGRAGVEDKSLDPDEFRRAFEHHWRHNDHHWEHWGGRWMPPHVVREMVADWMGAGRAYTGTWDVSTWYAKNRDRIGLHPASRRLAERLIANQTEGR